MIFVVGNSRSGTTMLGRVLGAHSKVYSFEELHFFENLVDDAAVMHRPGLSAANAVALVIRLLTSARSNIFAKPRVAEYFEEAKEIVDGSESADALTLYKNTLAYEVARNKKAIICEQTPRYLFSLDVIFSAFPDAVVINMVRDPRDVMLSQKNKWRTFFHGSWNMPKMEAVRSWANYHPIFIAKLWCACVSQAERYRDDARLLSVRFEDLLCEPERTVRLICSHVGVSYEPHMLDIAYIGSSIDKDLAGKSGINSGVAGRWKNGGLSDAETAMCQKICGEKMRAYGYDFTGATYSILQLFISIPGMAIKGALSLMLNFSRNRNIFTSIKKRFFN